MKKARTKTFLIIYWGLFSLIDSMIVARAGFS